MVEGTSQAGRKVAHPGRQGQGKGRTGPRGWKRGSTASRLPGQWSQAEGATALLALGTENQALKGSEPPIPRERRGLEAKGPALALPAALSVQQFRGGSHSDQGGTSMLSDTTERTSTLCVCVCARVRTHGYGCMWKQVCICVVCVCAHTCVKACGALE